MNAEETLCLQVSVIDIASRQFQRILTARYLGNEKQRSFLEVSDKISNDFKIEGLASVVCQRIEPFVP